jgi:hypothetical protein
LRCARRKCASRSWFAYLLAFGAEQLGGKLAAPKDLASSLHLKLDRGAHATANTREGFKRVTADNLDDAAHRP